RRAAPARWRRHGVRGAAPPPCARAAGPAWRWNWRRQHGIISGGRPPSCPREGDAGEWGMRDTTIARRTLLGLAAGFAISFRDCDPAAGAPPARNRLKPDAERGGRKPRTIAVDAGHGGIDPGAISPRGTKEKTVTLAVARELERQLNASGRYRVVLTRRRDVLVKLRERVIRARRHRAELLLSIHADALPDSGIRGLSVYTLSDKASDRDTAVLAS